MLSKIIPLSGSGRGTLTITLFDGQARAVLRPPRDGTLILSGDGGMGQMALTEGKGEGGCSFAPRGAVLRLPDGALMQGGFGGAKALEERARAAALACTANAPEKKVQEDAWKKSTQEENARIKGSRAENAQAQSALGKSMQEERIRIEGAQAESARDQNAWGEGAQEDPDGFPPTVREEEGSAGQKPKEDKKRQEDRAFRSAPERQSEALLAILQKAKEFFGGPAEPTAPDMAAANDAVLNPFPEEFPVSRWKRVDYPATGRYYLTGEVLKAGGEYTIYALPGQYVPGAMRAKGFTRFLRGRDGSGYWIKISKKR